jgi:hypothetical protein
MKIKIVAENAEKIQTALNEANGKANAHTYNKASDVIDSAAYFETQVVGIVGSQKAAVGAIGTDRSGSQLPNKYQNSRIVTLLTMERTSSGWFLTDVQTVTAWKEAGKQVIKLTAEQDAAAISHLRKQYVYPVAA